MFRVLLSNDLKYMKKDPMMWALLLMPIIMIAFYWLALQRITFLMPYLIFFQYMFITMIPVFVGVILGFRILDEKDEHMLTFYAVTPIKIKGYFLYRSLFALGLSIVETTMIVVALSGFTEINIFIIGQGIILAPLSAMGISILCKNKIQGMALSKALGLIVMLPLIRQLGENRLEGILRLLPHDYLYKMIVEREYHKGIYAIYMGLILVAIYLLIRWACQKCIAEI